MEIGIWLMNYIYEHFPQTTFAAGILIGAAAAIAAFLVLGRFGKDKAGNKDKDTYRMLTDAFVQFGLTYDFQKDRLTIFSGNEEEIDIPAVVDNFHEKLRKHQLRMTLTEQEFDELCENARSGKTCQTEFQCGRKESGWNWYHMIYSVEHADEAGERPVRLTGCLLDIEKQHQRQEKLAKMGQIDSLTRVYNRTGGEIKLNEALNHLEEYSQNAFLLLDVDWFKQTNDKFGHLCGDDVLKEIGKNIRDIFQGDTIMCRWGGDEFILFVRGPGAEKDLLEKRIAELQDRMKRYRYGEIYYPIGLSIGGIVPKKGMTLRTLFGKADEVLYQVKENGRDDFIISNVV